MRPIPYNRSKVLPLLAMLATALLFTLTCLVPPAMAEKTRPMSGTHMATDVLDACNAAGGKFDVGHDEHGDATTYGCNVKNCDGKGGDCSVTCGAESHTCVGSTPKIIVSATLLMMLQNGSNVNHSYGAVEGATTPNHPTETEAPKSGGQPGGPPIL